MAQKRMFDRAIIETDAFLNISMSAKALYFLLGMECDDEGFVSPTRVLRLYGGEIGDIKNLIDVGLVIRFQSGVLVITDWNQNNYLDKNRIKPTQYQNEKSQLALTRQGKYELNSGLTVVQPEEYRGEERRGEQKRIVKNTSDASASRSPEVFSLKTEVEKLEENDRRDLNIIAHYIRERKPKLETKEQLQIAIRRHLRSAKLLVPFTDDQIMVATKKAKTEYPDIWTLETLVKVLTK